jgi:lipopolysaccharide/colanic/teichoic acid biosynthesis glycosyltransferase
MYLFFKRGFDIGVSFIVMVFALPLFLFTGILLLFSVGWPCVFSQQRLGFKGRVFTVYKFCTMTSECDAGGVLLSDERRLTRLGSLIRKLSLDELPQLFNVLKGDMSLVGPRPLITEYKELYSKKQFRRHECRPGITGWAQVNGRNAISWADRFDLDVQYVDTCSFFMDMRILVLTVYVVFLRKGIASDGSVTMQKFDGLN